MDQVRASELAVAASSPSPWWGGRPVEAVNATQLGTQGDWLVELGTTDELPNSPWALVWADGTVREVAWDDALKLLGIF